MAIRPRRARAHRGRRSWAMGAALAFGAAALALVASSDLRRAVGEAALSVAAAAGARAIAAAEEAMIAAGATPPPPAIARDLCRIYSPDLVASVRHRVGWGDPGSPGQWALERFGKAITLGRVVVFRDEGVAADPVVWAHEVAHVAQYRQWGVEGFARRYLVDRAGVERDAWRETTRWAEAGGEPGGCD